MNPIKASVKLIGRQYGLLNLPSIRSPRFLSLITGSEKIASMTLQGGGRRRKHRSFGISFNEKTAVTTDKLDIRIPAWYCFSEALENLLDKSLSKEEAACISLVLTNGSTVHEALHVRYSEKLFLEATLVYIQKHKNRPLFSYIVNVVEDVKNEAILRNLPDFEDFVEFVDMKNEIFFTEEGMEKVCKEEEKLREDGKSSSSKLVCDLLVFYKCVSRREALRNVFNAEGFPQVGNILESVTSGYEDTMTVSERLFDILNRSLEEEGEFDPKETAEEQQSSEADAQVQISKEDQEFLERMVNKGFGEIPPLLEKDVLQINHRGNLETFKQPLSFKFMKDLKVVRQVVPIRREPMKSGSTLVATRLARIATDGKIFSTRGTSVSSIQRKLPEFIILGDFSSSMSGIIARVISVLEEISKEMLNCGIPYSIYGHTSFPGSHGEDQPILYHIFSNKMNGKSNSDHRKRFEMARQIYLCQNYDGHAIKAVSTKFNKGSENRNIIVLSDGAPSGINYEEGEEHTKNVISDVRKRGTKVISLSLVSSVILENDEIYGKKFNVDATSQQKLEEGLHKIIMGT